MKKGEEEEEEEEENDNDASLLFSSVIFVLSPSIRSLSLSVSTPFSIMTPILSQYEM